MTTAGSAVDDLMSTAGTLWSGSEVVPGSSGDGSVRARYAVAPNARAPRMLVPLDPPAARSASLLRFSAASSRGQVALRFAAAAAARVAPGAVLRDRIEVRGGGPGLAEHLASVLGTPVTFSVTIGSRRVNRKPVLQVFDPDGRCIAFAKVGWSDTAADDVTAEGRALDLVTRHRFDLLQPPTLLARSTWEGRPLLVIGALRPSPWRHPRRAAAPPVAAMEELASAFALPDGPVPASDWWRRQRLVAESLPDPEARDRLSRCLDRVADIAGDRAVSWGAWHGDWTPWNMARADGRIALWDWERFETGVPRGLDRTHYVVNALTERRGSSPAAIAAGLARAAGGDPVPGSAAALPGLLYLVAVSVRYLGLVDTAHGQHIAGRAGDTLAVLERWCG